MFNRIPTPGLISAVFAVLMIWIVMCYAFALLLMVQDDSRRSVADQKLPVAVCAEDSWCFNPLTQGNHIGAVSVFPGQPFRVIASYPQVTS